MNSRITNNSFIMKKGNATAIVTDETRAESARLKALWEKKENKLSQVEFGEKYGIGNQSSVSQFLRGVTPISLKAAIGFAEGLGCEISDFSPRLAREAQMIGRAVQSYQSALPGQMEQSGNAINVFGKDNELTEKAEMETLKMQAELAQKDAEIARKEAEVANERAEAAKAQAEAAKALARAEIAEARLKMCELQINDFQLLKSGLKRAERKLAETELALARARGEIAGLKKTGEKSKV